MSMNPEERAETAVNEILSYAADHMHGIVHSHQVREIDKTVLRSIVASAIYADRDEQSVKATKRAGAGTSGTSKKAKEQQPSESLPEPEPADHRGR